jgi:hypothetical protein
MTTEAVHDPNPQFKITVPIWSKKYSLALSGYYTESPTNWTAGGVTEWRFKSDDPVSRLNELLGFRSIFLNWWLWQWVENGGDVRDGALCVVAEILNEVELLSRR